MTRRSLFIQFSIFLLALLLVAAGPCGAQLKSDPAHIAAEKTYQNLRTAHDLSSSTFSRFDCVALLKTLKEFEDSLPIIHDKIAFYKQEIARIKMLLKTERNLLRIRQLNNDLTVAEDSLKSWQQMLQWTNDAIKRYRKEAAINHCR